MNRLAIVALGLLLGASWAQAGVYIVTGIGISTSQVHTYHFMEADSSTAYYYDVEVDGFIQRDSGPGTSHTTIHSGYDTGDASAEKDLYYSKTNNRGYLARSEYWLFAYYWYTVGSTIIYQDWLGYGLLNTSGYGGTYTINEPGTYTEQMGTDEIYLGAAWIGDNTYPPTISAIVITGSPVRGGSGYVEVYGANLAKWAAGSTASISGSGVTANVIYQDYINPGQVNLSYSISSGAGTGNRNLTVSTPFGTSNSKTFTIYDHSPVITSMPRNYWGAGGSTIVEIIGNWFGTNPQVSVSGNGTSPPTIQAKSDTYIRVAVPVSHTASDGSGTLTVTASNMNGGLFQQQPGGGGAQTSANATILSKNSFSMALEVDDFEVDADGTYDQNDYSEDTTIRITAVRNSTAQALQGWTGTVPIQETGTAIYSQNGGSLPSSVNIPYGSGGATTTFVASSRASYRSIPTYPYAAAPLPAQITTNNGGSSGFTVHNQSSLPVPQWVISTGTIDNEVCSGVQVYDWLQHQVIDIRAEYPSGDAHAVLGAISCYKSGAISGWAPAETSLSTAVVTLNAFTPEVRLKAGFSTCGTSGNGLVNVLIHEARHAYQAAMAAAYDADEDYLVSSTSAYAAYPNATVLDTTTTREVCRQGFLENRAYKGDSGGSSKDTLNAPDWAGAALQHDAVEFADLHD